MLTLYLEILGFKAIGRILKVNHVSVLNWIKKYGSKLEEIKNEQPQPVAKLVYAKYFFRKRNRKPAEYMKYLRIGR